LSEGRCSQGLRRRKEKTGERGLCRKDRSKRYGTTEMDVYFRPNGEGESATDGEGKNPIPRIEGVQESAGEFIEKRFGSKPGSHHGIRIWGAKDSR